MQRNKASGRTASVKVSITFPRQATLASATRSWAAAGRGAFNWRRSSPSEVSAAELADVLTQVRAGDSEAWGELYGLYAPAIFRFCRRALHTREDAEDATTEIFMKVRQKLGTYDSTRPFTAWLYKVASNHCWDLLRRRRIRQDLETGDLETLPLEHPDPSQLEKLQAE